MPTPRNDPDEDDELEARWPTASDQAFVPKHPLYGATTADDARERLWRMVKGYRYAADVLVDEAEKSHHKQRDLIYPIVFCYRHSLEIGLKQFLAEHGQYIGETPEFRAHKLEAIWPRCRKVIEHFNPSADPAPLDAIANIVSEFSKNDPESFTFRYASDTKGRTLNLKIASIGLTELRGAMAGIHNFLECVDLQIHSIDYSSE